MGQAHRRGGGRRARRGAFLEQREAPPTPVIDWRRRAADIDRYDKLGPLTKALLDHSPQDVQVSDFLPEFMRERASIISKEPNDPELAAARFDAERDKRMADFLLARIRQKYPRWTGPI